MSGYDKSQDPYVYGKQILHLFLVRIAREAFLGCDHRLQFGLKILLPASASVRIANKGEC